jgi:hypothetical protein
MQDTTSLISLNVGADTPELKDLCLSLNFSYLCISVNAINSEFINKIHQFRLSNPLFTHSYPVQTEMDWKRMVDCGVDVIQTDYPEALYEYIEEKLGYKK